MVKYKNTIVSNVITFVITFGIAFGVGYYFHSIESEPGIVFENSPGSVVSQDQSIGITAGEVNIFTEKPSIEKDETEQKNNLFVRPIPLEPINGTHRLLFEFGTQTYPKAIEIGLTFNGTYNYVDDAIARPNHQQFPIEGSNFINFGSTNKDPPIFTRRLIDPEITERKSYYLYVESENPLKIIKGIFREYNP